MRCTIIGWAKTKPPAPPSKESRLKADPVARLANVSKRDTIIWKSHVRYLLLIRLTTGFIPVNRFALGTLQNRQFARYPLMPAAAGNDLVSEFHYHSPNVQTGPQPPDKCLWLRKWLCISAKCRAFSSLRIVEAHLTGLAPASSSSQRWQPEVLRPNTGPFPLLHVCLVVMTASLCIRQVSAHKDDYASTVSRIVKTPVT